MGARSTVHRTSDFIYLQIRGARAWDTSKSYFITSAAGASFSLTTQTTPTVCLRLCLTVYKQNSCQLTAGTGSGQLIAGFSVGNSTGQLIYVIASLSDARTLQFSALGQVFLALSSIYSPLASASTSVVPAFFLKTHQGYFVSVL